ncbi:MAG TPA: hypothetical protein VGC54_11605, partial [Planctomycetota bacterium]
MSAGRLNTLYETYRDQVQFYVVYIAEAHALDGRSPLGGGRNPLVEEPVDDAERIALAGKCVTAMSIRQIPAV